MYRKRQRCIYHHQIIMKDKRDSAFTEQKRYKCCRVQITIQHCSHKPSRRFASVNTGEALNSFMAVSTKEQLRCSVLHLGEMRRRKGGRFGLGWIQFRIFLLNLHTESPKYNIYTSIYGRFD